MVKISSGTDIQIFSTCPQSKDGDAAGYAERVAAVARWSEEAGCTGMLVYTDNGLADPWLVAQHVLASTPRLCPLVAVQPIYLHPYAAAKMVASLALLHGRKIWLNMLAGGFRNDLEALGDDTPHDERYLRTAEYTRIVTGLLAGETISFAGRHYRVRNLRMTPALPPELFPGLFMSGSSEAGLAAARAVGAIAVKYPKPAAEEQADGDSGIRVGIVARDEAEEAWRVAHLRFPSDRKGQITHKLATKTSDSHWHRELSDLPAGEGGGDDPYWLHPFHTYKTFCPYLVGSHDRVAEALAAYMRRGFTRFILDIPPSREELDHVRRCFDRAAALAEA